ncbi:phosphotransferase [Nocardioides zeae]|uniref:Aminoglycoside phosphotransferase (APT) family kinase protein n=1 Tax=Nocardioides zeae TaxID=1457234 RepID=A0AAJ1X284_9ACTN|nr:phosphotransferase [Nocardioides zeae]MDQ1106343.1 aminoglycoside phosphotransferase (APT) family kinase protein [Nocardioides zeae]
MLTTTPTPATTGFPAIRAEVAAAGLDLERAQPRSGTHLLLHLREPATGGGPGGDLVPGQWFADAEEADRVARRTAATAPAGAVERRGDHVVVQRHGADRRLPELAPLVAAPGTHLVAHRPERRAVVRVDRGDAPPHFVKVLRGDRAAGAAATLEHLAGAGLPVPRVRPGTPPSLLVTEALPGTTLHDLLATGAAVTTTDLHAVGGLVRRLHEVAPPAGTPRHDAGDEAELTGRAVGLAAAYGLGVPAGLHDAVARLAAVPAPERSVLLHRDLHDKQLLRDPATGAWSLLDLDLLALGDPALDLANMVVHLELRARQGLLDPTVVERWSAALLEGYGADERTRVAVDAHAAVARVRLAAVYAFRPGGG